MSILCREADSLELSGLRGASAREIFNLVSSWGVCCWRTTELTLLTPELTVRRVETEQPPAERGQGSLPGHVPVWKLDPVRIGRGRSDEQSPIIWMISLGKVRGSDWPEIEKRLRRRAEDEMASELRRFLGVETGVEIGSLGEIVGSGPDGALRLEGPSGHEKHALGDWFSAEGFFRYVWWPGA